MSQTSFTEVQKIMASGDYQRIPVVRELFADVATPVEVMKKFMNISQHCFMLESVTDRQAWGRYTFIGYDPVLEVTCLDHRLMVKSGSQVTFPVVHPAVYIKALMAANKAPVLPGLPTFTGGLAGYFAYDYIKYAESALKLDAADTEGFNDVDLMLFDKLVVFDHYRQKLLLIVNIRTDELAENYDQSLAVLAAMEQTIRSGAAKQPAPGRLLSELTPLFSESEYCQKVATVKQHIYEGDIFQLVLSNRLEAKFTGSLFDVYRLLRTTNPSPYLFYFAGPDQEIAGASPETLVKVTGDQVWTYPLAGTRPRGQTAAEDSQLEAELRADEKELAEHNMLVDLGRNDCGKVARFGSVTVDRYLSVLKFSHVMHLGSTVSATLRPDKSALDTVEAILPAGTLSGAPKFKACQLIDELENNKRGIYGGAIGYLDFTGNLDTCIGIRLAYAKNGKVFVRSGAGIVADSVPETEYRECINKAKAVVSALENAPAMEVQQ